METDIRKESGPIINGCSVVSFSRMSFHCRKCDYRDYCDSKRRESVAAIAPDLRPNPQIDNIAATVISTKNLCISEINATEAINHALRCMAEKR